MLDEVKEIKEKVLHLLNQEFCCCDDDFTHDDIVSVISDTVTDREVTIVPFRDYTFVFKISFSGVNELFFFNSIYSNDDGSENFIEFWF